jgi:hypothetical protein
MDPDATLKRIREIIHTWETEEWHNYHMNELLVAFADLAENCHALDRWLAAGNFLPDRWKTESGRRHRKIVRPTA